MVISLDSEIATFEPFGRSIVSSVPEHKSRGGGGVGVNGVGCITGGSSTIIAANRSPAGLASSSLASAEDLHLTLAHHLHNDFTAAEIDSTRDLFRSLHGVSMSSQDEEEEQQHPQRSREFWRVRQCAKGEEEIYVSENTVVCSYKQSGGGTSLLDKTFTFSERILDANWCAFITNDNLNGIATQDLSKLMFKAPGAKGDKQGGGGGQIGCCGGGGGSQYPKFLLASPQSSEGASKSQQRQHHLHSLYTRQLRRSKAVCVLDKISIHMLTESGDHHRKSLQFKIKKMVPTPFGLLLEREIRDSERLQDDHNQLGCAAAAPPPYPLIFTLSNPLNEIVPALVANYSGKTATLNSCPQPNIGYITSQQDFVLVDFIVERHFAVFYCTATGLHSIFYLRPVNGAELDWIRQDLEKPMYSASTVAEQFASQSHPHPLQTPQSAGGVPMDVDHHPGPHHSGPFSSNSISNIKSLNDSAGQLLSSLNHPHPPPPPTHPHHPHHHLISTPISNGELTKKRCRLSYPSGGLASSSSPITRSMSSTLLGNLGSGSGGGGSGTQSTASAGGFQGGGRLSSPRNATAAASTGVINSPLNSGSGSGRSGGGGRHSSANALSSGASSGGLEHAERTKRGGGGGILSPSTSKLTTLLSSRLDSPLSPSASSFRLPSTSQHHHHYSTSTSRLMETDVDLAVGGSGSGTTQRSRSRSVTKGLLGLSGTPSPMVLNSSSTAAASASAATNTPSVERGGALYDDLLYARKYSEPIIAEFTLDYVWSETAGNSNSAAAAAAPATKVFATVDLLGQNYLALLVVEGGGGGNGNGSSATPVVTSSPSPQSTTTTTVLRLIKFEVLLEEKPDDEGEDDDDCPTQPRQPRYLFGSTTRIAGVKDAQPLPALNMLLLLDDTGSLLLYSGTERVAIVHLQPTLMMGGGGGVIPSSPVPPLLNDSLAAMSPNFRNFFSSSAPVAAGESPSDGSLSFSLLSTVNTSRNQHHLPPTAHSSPIVQQQLNSSNASVGSCSGSTLQLDGSSDNLLQQQQKSKPNPLLPPPFSIQQYPAYGRISALRDPIEGRVTLATEEGRHWRVAFPALASTFLVERCLAALRQAALPRKEAAAFLAAWYTFRNATKDEREEAVAEVALFKLCLLSMVGYDLAGARLGLGLKSGSGEDAAATAKVTKTEAMGGTHHSLAINIAVSSPQPVGHSETLEREITKKMKIEEGDQGTDEDWLEMLRNAGSLYGLSRQKLMKEATATGEQKASATIGGFSGHQPQQAASHLGKTPTTARSLKAVTPSSPPSSSSATTTTSFTFTAPGPLFPYTANILSTLHLLYEDLKLVQMNWPLCRSLVDLLYLLAVDLDLADYQDHYYRDFADVCAETIPRPSSSSLPHLSNGSRFGAHRAKISAAIKALETSGPPPSIFATLYGMLSPPPPAKSSTVKKTSAVSEADEKSSTPPLSTPFPFIGNGAPSRCLSTGGAHIITPNIFNLVVLYANLHAEALVQPSAVLRCVSLPAPVHHFQQPNSTAATASSAAQTSTPTASSSSSPGAYINVAKYRQTVGLFGGSGQSPSNSPSTATTRMSGGNNQFAYDLSAEALQRLAISGAAAAAAAGAAPCSSSSTPKVTTTTPGSSTPSTPSTPSSALSSQLLTTARQRVFERREKLLFLMSAFGVTADYLKELPFGLALPLWDVIYAYRQAPKNDWPSAIYSLIDRPDLLSLEYQEHIGAAVGGGVAAGASGGTAATTAAAAASYSGGSSTGSSGANMAGDEDGHTSGGGGGGNGASTEEEAEAAAAASELAHLDHAVLRLLFPTDQRLHEAYQTMLLSSRPAVVALTQRHGVSDHDFVEEQERHLYALLIRSMAAPLGRGMVTLRSYHPVAAERFPVPPVVLTGRVPPRNTALELSHIEVPANLNVWPLFHNGVSAGLRIVGNGGGGGGSGIGSAKPSSSSSSNSSGNSKVDSSWILFNKPANSTATSEEHYAHAGFLLALGLNGLLDHLSIMDLHEYLSKGNDLTKVAILLGLAASRRGTMDSNPYILLGIHLEGLLPSTSTELDVSPIVKVAAVLGVGLLFQGTGHAYIAEVMLNEIGRPPGPEMEHYIDRESYALSAGLAFGLVTLGRGDEMIGSAASAAAAAASGSASAYASSSSSADGGISIPDQLNHYMLGVHKKLSTLAKEKHKTPSYHIREGDCINADVTSPGATLALGMMFFGTGNRAIAQWLEVPDTQNLLETVRPDFILLRVLAKSLILWADVRPTTEWIESHIPAIIFNNAFQKVAESGGGSRSGGSYGRGSSGAHDNVMLPNEDYSVADSETDYETMTQSYCNIIAGACFALALRYAGSADAAAFEVVKKYTVKLISIIQKGSSAQIEQAGRSTIESCVNVLIVSCSIIMAGTGNVEVMRLCRFLRSRVNQVHVLYGSFMAAHVALGLLFLGGCRMTLNSSPQSVAALICAFFPKWPIHTYDNRYHLQAFRHLYVLATEPRMVIPRCIDTGTAVYAKVLYRFKEGSGNKVVEKMAPCLLPDLQLLHSVEMVDENYWGICFEEGSNFEKLRKCLLFNGNLYIKRKVKCLSYNKEFIYNVDSFGGKESEEVPKGGGGEDDEVGGGGGSGTFSTSLFHKIDRKSFTLFDFTNEVILKTFSDIFIRRGGGGGGGGNSSGGNQLCSEEDIELKNRLCAILYDCAEDETLELFAPLIKLLAAGWAVVEEKKRAKWRAVDGIGEKVQKRMKQVVMRSDDDDGGDGKAEEDKEEGGDDEDVSMEVSGSATQQQQQQQQQQQLDSSRRSVRWLRQLANGLAGGARSGAYDADRGAHQRLFTLWQIKLAVRFIESCRYGAEQRPRQPKFKFIGAIQFQLEQLINATVDKVEARRYLYGHLPISQASEALIDTAVYYDLPTGTRLALTQHQEIKLVDLLTLLRASGVSRPSTRSAFFIYKLLKSEG